ncbi:MAG: HIT family protein [Candidatus Lokiarchaeia archaeon]|nr:HIT family protein [Candidatus Lokiarchaeia archaeon]
MKQKDCIFCKIANKDIPSKILFENDFTLAFLDISPISNGHTIIIPKNHYSNIEDIPDHELSEVFKVVKLLAVNIHRNLKIDGYNILQNNFSAAGQVIKHFHVHIIPRSFEDKKFHIEIPRTQASEDELEEILNILKI